MEQTERYYKEEFKRQIVELYHSGKSVTELNNEYKISKTSIRKWIKQIETSGKFGAEPNRSNEEKEMRELRKENKQLKMENDILKQAALIMGRKDV